MEWQSNKLWKTSGLLKSFAVTTCLTFTELCCDSTVSTEAKNLLIDSVSVYEINDNSLKLSGAHGTFLKFSLKN